jgi:hypothetical protein
VKLDGLTDRAGEGLMAVKKKLANPPRQLGRWPTRIGQGGKPGYLQSLGPACLFAGSAVAFFPENIVAASYL